MTLEHKTPKARREARSYCRRCLAVMLCCVLAFGLTVRTAPRAQADVAAATVGLIGAGGGEAAAAGALGSNPIGATIGLLLLVAAGVPISAGYVHNEDSIFYGTKGYEIGAECWDYLCGLGDDVWEWYSGIENDAEENGGILPGTSISVPANVAEAVRQWAVTNIDFTDGTAIYTQSGIYTDSGFLVFSQFPSGAVYGESYYYAYYGTWICCPPSGQTLSYRFEDVNGDVFRYDFYLNSKDQFQIDYYKNDVLNLEDKWTTTSSFTFVFAPGSSSSSTRYLAICSSGRSLSTGSYYAVQYSSVNTSLYMSEENMPLANAFDVSTTLAQTAALSEPITDDLTITIPATISTTQVGDLTIPVVGELTGEDLLDGADSDEDDDTLIPDATPWDKLQEWLEGLGKDITGAVESSTAQILDQVGEATYTDSLAGDQVMEEVMSEPDDLGAVFVSKFPFCIPWDIVKAVKLLAVPAETPVFEVDFYAPLEGKFGFHAQGSTKMVLDFSEFELLGAVCRWVSTLFFVYALASGTKKLIWTS